MPVEIRELIIKASIVQNADKAPTTQIDEEFIDKIKNEIMSEIMSEIKDKFDDILYKK